MEKVQLEIPAKTYLRFAIALVLGFLVFQLAPLILLLFISVLVAVTLKSVEKFLVRKGCKKIIADAFLILSLLGVLSGLCFFVIPSALAQMKDLLVHLPQLKAELTRMTPGFLQQSAGKVIMNSPDSLNRIWNQLALVANQTLAGLFAFGLMLISAVYMFLDGQSAYEWIAAFFSPEHRKKLDLTVQEIVPVVEAYIIGQAATSTIAALWVFTAASFLGIPEALILAVLAAFFDILPGIGFILNVLTAGLLALTVSTHTALMMVLSLMIYAGLENYVLIPHIYGHRMKLSPLVVLLSIVVSGAVAGIPGMIAVLPIVASYGPIERHWLRRSLPETVEIHEKVAEEENEHLRGHTV